MRRYTALEALRDGAAAPPCLAIGTFDGVHRGHQAVIAAMRQAAGEQGGPAAILTFVPHPMSVLRPAQAPPLLVTYAQRARLLEETGVEALVELPFTPEFSRVSPADFVAGWLCRRAGARRIFVGADFTFGARAAGTPATLAVLGRQACGLETTVVPLRRAAGAAISSTRIRQALKDGRLALARRLLGRPFAVEGPVVAGERRGRTIGFPTANLLPPPDLALPEAGVYAVRCRVLAEGAPPGPPLPGVANLGHRPTVGGSELRLEAHLLEFSGDLYGALLEVAFIRRLRGERSFSGLEALRRQIAHDAERARGILERDAERAAEH